MKISIITCNLGNNCLGRAYLLGKVLQRNYEVDIHGYIFPYSPHPIWKPCDTGEFLYNAEAGRNFPLFLKSMINMVRNIKGDVIYVSKPLLPNYGVSLLKKVFTGKPVILDIDDWEMGWFDHLKGVPWWKLLSNPLGPLYTRWMEHYIGFADEITTVSTQLQELYGRGVIVPHGRDTEAFDPAKFDRDKFRKELNINGFKVVMFLGSIRPHKGLDDIVQSLNILDRDDIRLMVIGAGEDPIYEDKLKKLGKEKVILKGLIPFNEIPQYLSASDLVVLPQKKTKQSYGQIPAKLFDAMAMAKPIIATNVADLPKILDGCGIIVESEDVSMLAEKIAWVFSNQQEAEEMGKKAREKCIEEYSWDAMETKLKTIFGKYE